MALVWIVTTGNSDFKVNRVDGFLHLRTEKNQQLKPCQKQFSSLVEGDDNLFSLPARVMGIIYGDTWETYNEYFRFPLLAEFVKKLKDERRYPDRIIVLLTNQEGIFLEDSDDPRYDRSEDSPYWRDTSRLEPILAQYFDQEFGVKAKFIPLEPKTIKDGLDNWDSALKLVQEKITTLGIAKDDLVIVSHQASTPAVSSALQFASLSKFGEQVSFLISNERDTKLTRFLEGSEYLKGIRKREAQTLLARYDYSGAEALIRGYLKDDKDTTTLLNAAIQWNFAKFDDFANELERLPEKFSDLVQEVKERRKCWWWEAYEAAYLGVVRLRQGNTVEAMFHSFRSVEGLLYKWVMKYHSEKLEDRSSGGKDIVVSRDENGKPKKTYNAYGKKLYWFLNSYKTIGKKKNEDIWVFGNFVFDRRNELFHQLRGLRSEEVFKNWQSPDETQCEHDPEGKWKTRILNCLNFIAKEDLPKEFESPEDASLMAQVHCELEKSLANL